MLAAINSTLIDTIPSNMQIVKVIGEMETYRVIGTDEDGNTLIAWDLGDIESNGDYTFSYFTIPTDDGTEVKAGLASNDEEAILITAPVDKVLDEETENPQIAIVAKTEVNLDEKLKEIRLTSDDELVEVSGWWNVEKQYVSSSLKLRIINSDGSHSDSTIDGSRGCYRFTISKDGENVAYYRGNTLYVYNVFSGETVKFNPGDYAYNLSYGDNNELLMNTLNQKTQFVLPDGTVTEGAKCKGTHMEYAKYELMIVYETENGEFEVAFDFINK